MKNKLLVGVISALLAWLPASVFADQHDHVTSVEVMDESVDMQAPDETVIDENIEEDIHLADDQSNDSDDESIDHEQDDV